MKKNIKFQCQDNCGKCCVSHGEYGFTYLTEEDMVRLEKHLGVNRDQFAEEGLFDYTRHGKGKKKMWYLKNTKQSCTFLVGTKCGIYEARPIQCRTFPFWPENMNAKAWRELKNFCPGIDKGPVLPRGHVNKMLEEQRRADSKN